VYNSVSGPGSTEQMWTCLSLSDKSCLWVNGNVSVSEEGNWEKHQFLTPTQRLPLHRGLPLRLSFIIHNEIPQGFV